MWISPNLASCLAYREKWRSNPQPIAEKPSNELSRSLPLQGERHQALEMVLSWEHSATNEKGEKQEKKPYSKKGEIVVS